MTMPGAYKLDQKGRPAGRRKERKGTGIGGQFSPRLVEMQESPAYRVLSLSAHRALDRIEIEFGHHGGTDNGHLPVTFQDFEDYGIHRHSIAPAIRELEALGFIEVTERGRAGNSEYRKANRFRITYRPVQPQAATNEWRRIETLERAEEIKDSLKAMTSKPGKKRWTRPRLTRVAGICTEDLESSDGNRTENRVA